MPTRKTVRRVAALSFVGAAVALYAAQAGSLPGLHLLQGGANAPLAASETPQTPGTRIPAALAALQPEVVSVSASTAHVPDGFVRTQSHALPLQAGFRAPPEPDAGGAVHAVFPEAASIRPAAFHPADALETPVAPTARPADVGDGALSPLGLPCGLDVTADAAPHATIALGIAAPCHPGASVTIRHSGLTFTARTDAVGLLGIDLPAFETPAFISVELPDGTAQDALLPIPDLADYDRVALVAAGGLDMELHAVEGDAGWFTSGHLHRGAPRTPDAALDGLGYLTVLGEGGIQVYSRPRSGSTPIADVRFTVDAPVTAANCAREARAGLLTMRDGEGAQVTPLSFTYPGCDAVGDTLVLQNALGTLRLAAD